MPTRTLGRDLALLGASAFAAVSLLAATALPGGSPQGSAPSLGSLAGRPGTPSMGDEEAVSESPGAGGQSLRTGSPGTGEAAAAGGPPPGFGGSGAASGHDHSHDDGGNGHDHGGRDHDLVDGHADGDDHAHGHGVDDGHADDPRHADPGSYAMPDHPAFGYEVGTSRAADYAMPELMGCHVDHPYIAWLVDTVADRIERDFPTMLAAMSQGFIPMSPVPNDFGYPETYWHWWNLAIGPENNERDEAVQPHNWIEYLLLVPAYWVEGETISDLWVTHGVMFAVPQNPGPELYPGCAPFHNHEDETGGVVELDHMHMWPWHHVHPFAMNPPHLCDAEGNSIEPFYGWELRYLSGDWDCVHAHSDHGHDEGHGDDGGHGHDDGHGHAGASSTSSTSAVKSEGSAARSVADEPLPESHEDMGERDAGAGVRALLRFLRR